MRPHARFKRQEGTVENHAVDTDDDGDSGSGSGSDLSRASLPPLSRSASVDLFVDDEFMPELEGGGGV